jgi:hypothetical protein
MCDSTLTSTGGHGIDLDLISPSAPPWSSIRKNDWLRVWHIGQVLAVFRIVRFGETSPVVKSEPLSMNFDMCASQKLHSMVLLFTTMSMLAARESSFQAIHDLSKYMGLGDDLR